VLGKNGHKMKESAPEPPPDPNGAPGPPPFSNGPMKMGSDGFPEMPAGRDMMFMMNGRTKMQSVRKTMPQLAMQLSTSLGIPVVDKTGLEGKYDFVLTWSGANAGGPIALGPPPPPPPGAGGG